MSEPSHYNVVISDDAKAMLTEHVSFLSNISIPAAEKLIDRLEEALLSLSMYPHRHASYVLRRVKGSYRRMVVGRYALIYTVSDAEKLVRVIYILDTRQDISGY